MPNHEPGLGNLGRPRGITSSPGLFLVLARVGLGSCAGASGYDPVVMNVPKWLLAKCFTDAQEGLTVRLSTGESGVICDPSYGATGRPLVRISATGTWPPLIPRTSWTYLWPITKTGWSHSLWRSDV